MLQHDQHLNLFIFCSASAWASYITSPIVIYDLTKPCLSIKTKPKQIELVKCIQLFKVLKCRPINISMFFLSKDPSTLRKYVISNVHLFSFPLPKWSYFVMDIPLILWLVGEKKKVCYSLQINFQPSCSLIKSVSALFWNVDPLTFPF